MQYEPNKIYKNEFGQVSGVFIVDKPIGRTSHDIVDEFRRKFQTRKVGHAGALDPFASGVLIILVGKAVKLSDTFLNLGKEYVAEIAFGFKTETLDTEGENLIVKQRKISQNELENVLKSFQPEYLQEVPLYSSVKVKGHKLRELIRGSESTNIVEGEGGARRVQFFRKGNLYHDLEIPRKIVRIEVMDVKSLKEIKIENANMSNKFKELLESNSVSSFQSTNITFEVSKGTYIRKLAEDIGEELGTHAMLIGLRRTKVGEYSIDAAL